MLGNKTAWRRSVAALLMYVYAAQQSWALLADMPRPIPELPRVIIRGTYEGQDFWNISNEVVNVPWTQPQDPGHDRFREVASGRFNATDIRMLCNVPIQKLQDLASTTSNDDEVARQDAVRAVVGLQNIRWTAILIWGRLTGRAIQYGGRPRVVVTVTFADGGTENYFVNPLTSDSAQAVPGTLRPGNGVPVDVPCQP